VLPKSVVFSCLMLFVPFVIGDSVVRQSDADGDD
jgi:hypothetical protein